MGTESTALHRRALSGGVSVRKPIILALTLPVLLAGLSFASAAPGKPLDEKAKINYSVGYQIGGDFKAQKVDLDPEALVQGVRDALKDTKPLLSQDEMKAVLVEMKKKIVAKEQAKEKEAKAQYRQASAAFVKENAKKEGVTVLPDGIQYKVLKAGTGAKPTLKDEVKVNYRVSRVDGKEIGSTYGSGMPRTLALSGALPGLREVLQLMPAGSKWQVVFPPGAASAGRDPMDDLGAVVYELELVSVVTKK